MNREPRLPLHAACELTIPASCRPYPSHRGLQFCERHQVYVDCRSYASAEDLEHAARTVPRTRSAVITLSDYATCRWSDEMTDWYERGMPGAQPMHYVGSFDQPRHLEPDPLRCAFCEQPGALDFHTEESLPSVPVCRDEDACHQRFLAGASGTAA